MSGTPDIAPTTSTEEYQLNIAGVYSRKQLDYTVGKLT